MTTHAQAEPPRPSPIAGRRNFRLSGLEMLIVALIVLGVIYLITMWVGSALSPEPEAAAPPPPGAMVEKALVASEKAQAQLSSLGKDLGALRKDLDSLQAQRPAAPGAPGQPASLPAAWERRLAELERQFQVLVRSQAPVAGLANEVRDMTSRLEKLEKKREHDKRALDRLDQALGRPLDDKAPAPAKPAEAPKPAPAAQIAKAERPEPPAAPAAAAERQAAPPPADKLAAAKAAQGAQAEPRKLKYKVQPGDTLLGLAHRYKVTAADLVRWNAQLLGERRTLRIGETLVIMSGTNS